MKNMFKIFVFFMPYICVSQTMQLFTTIDSRSELRNYSTVPNNRVIAAIGSSSAWDQPTEIWTFDATSMAVDDGVKVLKPNDIPIGSPGRYLFRQPFPKQYGTLYSKEWNGSVTTSTNAAVFDISSAGFASIVGLQAFAILPSGTIVNLPITSGYVSPSNTSVTINLVESKTTAVLVGGNIEGLETHSASNTLVYLTVKGN